MNYGEEVKQISLKHVQGKAARDTLSAIIEWTGNKINTAKKRWVFELLQNAIDTATERKNENLKIEIEKTDHTLVFKHNAGWFKQDEIAAIFYGGSTKPFERDSKYLGRFGTGFLVSHVLSRTVAVKAFFIDNQENILTCHPITIDRTGLKEEDISNAIDSCFVQLNKAEITEPQDEYWSEFTYEIIDETGQSAADDGIEILQKCLTLIFAFNYNVKSITINSVLYIPEYSKTGAIEAFKVNDTTFYFLKDNGVYVGILSKNNEVCLLDGIPRIFLAMPLVETTDFIKSPFIINSRQLAPTERRDALDNNQKINEEILIAAPKLYKTFLNHLTNSHDLQAKYNCLRIAEIPPNFQEQNPLWKVFNFHLKEEFNRILEETPIVQTTQGLLPLNKVYFPSNPDGIINDDLLEKFFKLVSQIKSNVPTPENNSRWLELVEQLKGLFPINQRVYNVNSLKNEMCTFIVGRKSFPKLEEIGESLAIEIPRNFLFQLYEYVDNLYEKGNIHSDFCENLLLDQSGIIGPIKGDTWKIHLENEHDPIDEELKDIVVDIGWEIRNDLLDNEFTRFKIIRDFVRDKISLEQITQTIQLSTYRLKDRIEEWDEKSIGWIRLFWWYISKNMSLPDDFPVITKNKEVESIQRKFLVPLQLMKIDERFEDIFPDKRILSTKYFEHTAFDSLEKLNQYSHIITSLPSYTRSVTIKSEKLRSIIEDSKFESFQSDHRLECKNTLISEIPFGGELIGRISDDINRAKLFFCFIFEYLAEKDKSWNLKTTANCTCSEGHHNILPSTWLASLKTDKWVPVKTVTENGVEDTERRQASKESIETLFSTEEFEDLLNNKRVTAMALLPHLGFDGLDLKIKIQSIETGKPEQILRNEVGALADINQRFPDLANLVADDPQGVENALRELKEQRKKEQRKNENKKIGENVELIVRQIVRRHGLQVKNIHKGADMEIWFEDENEQNWSSGIIEVDIDNTLFYLESKFTSTNSVHISPAQSEAARKYKERYLVFVVKNIPGLRDDLKVDMQEDQENITLQNAIIDNSNLIQNIFTKLGEEPNISEVEIDLNGYWIKKALWTNADNILDWLKQVTSTCKI